MTLPPYIMVIHIILSVDNTIYWYDCLFKNTLIQINDETFFLIYGKFLTQNLSSQVFLFTVFNSKNDSEMFILYTCFYVFSI